MANKTDNLNLTLPLGSDRPDINVLNQNFERIDSAYGQEREERINTDVELAAAIKAELDRASSRENAIESALNDEISRAKTAENANSNAISNETIRATNAENELAQNLSEEIERAQEAEQYIEEELSLEITRATLKENEISEILSNEITRAKGAENALADNLDAEILRAKSAEKTNTDAISNESVRATEKENEIATNLSSEVSRATGAESTLTNNLNAEITRAKSAEKSNTDAISAETTRATAKENEIDSNLSSEITRAESAESELNASISNEISRATQAEQDNADEIASEIARATQKEADLESRLNGEISRAKDAEKSNADSIAAHSANQSNPHAVTKEQVGLGNVPNVTTNDQTPSYAESSTLSALTNGEKLSIAFGKIAKAISSLISHLANTSNPHKVTKSQVGLGNVDDTSDKNKPVSTAQQSAIDLAYANSNAYTDQKISELINGAPTTLDTLGEIASAMAEHEDVVYALNEAIGTKANQTELDTHTGNDTIHITADERTNWNDANSKKHTHGNKSIIDTITQALIDNWNAAYTHISDTVKHITAEERENWNAAKTHADSAHAPSNAEENQNAFSNVVVGSTTIAADSKTDTLTFAGSNITLTPDATNDKVTIGITKDNVVSALGYTPGTSSSDTTYSPGTGLSLSGTTFNHKNSVTAGTAQGDTNKTLTFGGTFTIPTITYDAQGHITGKGTTTMTMPANPNTDTKNTAGSTDTSNKIFLVGATSQAANPQTYSDNQVYAQNGQLNANSVRVAEKVTLQYNSSTESLDFVFA